MGLVRNLVQSGGVVLAAMSISSGADAAVWLCAPLETALCSRTSGRIGCEPSKSEISGLRIEMRETDPAKETFPAFDSNLRYQACTQAGCKTWATTRSRVFTIVRGQPRVITVEFAQDGATYELYLGPGNASDTLWAAAGARLRIVDRGILIGDEESLQISYHRCRIERR